MARKSQGGMDMAKEKIIIPLRRALEDTRTGLRDVLEIFDAMMPVVDKYYKDTKSHLDIIQLRKLPKTYFEVDFSGAVPNQRIYGCEVWEDEEKVLRGDCLEAVKFTTKPKGLVRIIDETFDGYRLYHSYSGEFVLPAEMVIEHLQVRGFDLEVEISYNRNGEWFWTRKIRLVKEREDSYVELDWCFILVVVEFGTDDWRSFLKDMKNIYLEMELEVPEEDDGIPGLP